MVIDNDTHFPPPQPNGFSCDVPSSQSLHVRSQWVSAHGDLGRVIVTVPALGRPEVLRWDLTRHGLSSLPYSPDTGGRVGKRATRGEEIFGCGFSFIQTFFKATEDCLPSNKQPTLFYSTAQGTDSDSILEKAVKCVTCLSCWRCSSKMCLFVEFSLFNLQRDGGLQQFMRWLIKISAGECWVQRQWEPSNRAKLGRIPRREAEKESKQAERKIMWTRIMGRCPLSNF